MFVNINKSIYGPLEENGALKSAISFPPPPNDEKGWVLTSRYTKSQLILLEVPPLPKGHKFFRTYELEYDTMELHHREVFEICVEHSGQNAYKGGALYNYWQRPISYTELPKFKHIGQE